MNFKNYFFTLTIIFILAVSQAFAGDLYWVGNSGNWNDASHWAAVSGGKGGVGVPTLNDNVFVDDKSFSQKNAVLNINSSISVNNLNIISQKDFAITSSKNTEINIFGSIQVTANFNNQIKSDIRFKSAKDETVHLGWFVWQANIYFDGTGIYKLTSPIQNHEYSIYHNSGTLDLNRFDVLCGSFISNSNTKRTLISEKSTILTYHQFDVQDKKNGYDFSQTFLFNLKNEDGNNGSTDKTVNVVSIITDTSSCGDVCDGRIIVNFTTTCPFANVNWTPGTPQGDDDGANPITTGSDTIFNLCPGIEYSAIITNSCDGSTKIAKATVLGHAYITEFLPATIDSTSCNGVCDGQIDAFIDAASFANLSYQWTPGGIGDTLTSISGLCDGNYSLRVRDGFGCDTTFFYTVDEPDSVRANITVTDVTCFGTCTGSITSNPTGGTGPSTYTFQWFPTGDITPTISNLCDGSIDTVIVTDANGCVGDTVGIVSTVPQMQLDSSQINVSCGGYCNGIANVTVNSGGVPPFNHNWSN
ncbi:MAG: SprB repeat-containing protein, partial [Bacteroidetes bacterium]|nr:SprB repeat-containing protein [Bacteroidota bacterium]